MVSHPSVFSATSPDGGAPAGDAATGTARAVPCEAPYTEFPLCVGQPFTAEDTLQMRTVTALVPGLSALLGAYCEVVVNSLEHPEASVLASAHAALSGRTEGSFISRRGLDTILDLVTTGKEYHRYFPVIPTGQRLKAVIIPILNPAGRCLGTLSIGLNLEMPLAEFFRENTPSEPESDPPLFGGEPAALIERAFADAWRECMADPAIRQRDRIRHVVRLLHARGVFHLRDAVAVVSERLGISPATVYLHLRSLKKEADGA